MVRIAPAPAADCRISIFQTWRNGGGSVEQATWPARAGAWEDRLLNRLFTYSIASSVGLTIATILAAPALLSMRYDAAPAGPPGPAPADIAQALTAPAPAPADNQTLLSADIQSGGAIVTINNQPVGQFQAQASVDVSRFLHSGENAVRVMWVGPVGGDIRIQHAAAAGQFREVADCFLAPASTMTAGERTLTVYL
ncbi:MAG TPA: hypothetical protein VGM37_11570 [Armatimonadota bacterium]|jgi:hypothetical protein